MTVKIITVVMTTKTTTTMTRIKKKGMCPPPCSVVKPVALECFARNVTHCNYRERLLAIADESGGACYGNRLNREFKERAYD